jgi:LysM repeat protein
MNRKLKTPRLLRFKRKRLRASTSTARRRMRVGATADYEEMAEPNMKLSRALLIVLLLHVVAVAGIIAFNAIKTHQSSFATMPDPLAAAAPKAAGTPAAHSSGSGGAVSQKTAARSVGKDEHKIERAKHVEKQKGPADSGKVYVVVRGDNPVTIAKKFKVSYEDLIALNHIEDPRKLQIGQKLQIPVRPPKSKKGDR